MIRVHAREAIDPVVLEPQENWSLCLVVSQVVKFPFLLLAQAFAWVLSPAITFILQASLYRTMAVDRNCFTRQIISPFFQQVFNVWSCLRGGDSKMESIDPERLAKSEKFVEQFADFKTITTEDGRELRFALYKPEAFDRWIEERDGERDGEWIRPTTPESWEALKELNEFHWFEQVGQAFRLPERRADLDDKCILRIQGFGRKIPMDKAFIGAHMALGISYAVFDWRDGDLSSTGFLRDAEAAYQTLRNENYAPNQIIPMGSCRSTFVIGKLKEDHHAEGLNAVLIQPPPSLEKAIKAQNCIASFLGMSSISSIESEPGDYDTVARLKRLRHEANAGLCVILSENDTTLPQDTEAQFQQAAEGAGPLKIIVQATEPGVDAHLQEPLRDQAIFEQYVRFLQNA